MIKEFIYLSLIGYISYIYNLYIYPIVIKIISEHIYNNLIIFMIIIIQIDNIIIYNDLKIKKEIENDNENIYDRNMKIIIQQLSLIIKNQEEISIRHIRHQMLKNRKITRSLNDLSLLK